MTSKVKFLLWEPTTMLGYVAGDFFTYFPSILPNRMNTQYAATKRKTPRKNW